jgi:hypothetical protein
MNKDLRIGMQLATRSCLVSLTKRVHKMFLGIVESDLTQNKDAMNFPIVLKVTNERVITSLSDNDEECATKVYLQFIKHIIDAYIDQTTTPSQRIYAAWFCVWFCRFWKYSIPLVRNFTMQDRNDLYVPKISENFATTNVHVCIELNAHAILKYAIACRDLDKPETRKRASISWNLY